MKRYFSRKLPIVEKVALGDISFGQKKRVSRSFLLTGYMIGALVVYLVLAVRLFQLTVVKGGYYMRLSEENRARELIIEPRRGAILDRKGFVLAENTTVDLNKNAERLTSTRTYPFPEEFAHLIGYRQVADKTELASDNCIYKPRLGDAVGKKGIEKVFDCGLRGVAGRKIVEVDASGNYLRTVAVVPASGGQTVQLAVDAELQKVAYRAVMGRRAAVIVQKPKTGEILAFVSTPSFNPQHFEDGNPAVSSYFTDPDKPLFNRASEGVYPPGSIFKLVIATGALEEKKIDEKFTVEDNGFIKAGSLSFGNWYYLQYGKTEGMVDLVKAIRRSNDIYFYKVGERLGPDEIKKWATIFGLGERNKFGLEEADGTIPSPFWKQEVLHEQWYLGDTYNYSIGQGYALVTPLQMAMAAAVFGNGGYLCQPKLLKNEQPSCKKLPISEKTMNLIREGMREACEPGGTGWPLFNFSIGGPSTPSAGLAKKPTPKPARPLTKIPLACKTGTAESHAKSGMPHAWFTAFAPFENPEIAITVLIEEGGQGSDVGAPIAKEILTAYFERSE